MDELKLGDNIEISQAGRKSEQGIRHGLSKVKNRMDKLLEEAKPFLKKVPLEGQLKEKVEKHLEVANKVLQRMGYSKEELPGLLPELSEIHFFSEYDPYGERVTGGVDVIDRYLHIDSENNPNSNPHGISIVLDHELGHFPARKVIGPSSQGKNGVRNICVGFDTKLRYVNELGVQKMQDDDENRYFRGMFREPMADLFGYFCADERKGSNYVAYGYPRETCFIITILDAVVSVNQSTFFEEFAKMYKAFNTRNYDYFNYLSDAFAKHFIARGSNNVEAALKAREFVRGLNNVVTRRGKDEEQTDLYGFEVRGGFQINSLAEKFGLDSQWKARFKEINSPGGIKLNGSKTRMTSFIVDPTAKD